MYQVVLFTRQILLIGIVADGDFIYSILVIVSSGCVVPTCVCFRLTSNRSIYLSTNI